MFFTKRIKGVNLKKHKSTVGMEIEKLSAPKEIIPPMDMHLGKPASVLVKLGEMVKIGTLVGKKDELISANIHSSVSGTVKKIEKCLIGNKITNVVIIKSDYREVLDDSMPKKVYWQIWYLKRQLWVWVVPDFQQK